MSQANFKFISEAAGGSQFTVVSFTAHEAISSLYEYQIEITAPLSAAISLDDVLDSSARFVTELDGKEYPVFGMLSNFEELQTVQDYVFFKAVLVPRLWALSIYKTNEIYTQEKTVDLIIQTVLENAGLYEGSDYDLNGLVKGHLLSRDYVCQFGESDFDFISRLMENEGIFYYFDHSSGDAEKIIFINDMNYELISRPALTFDVTASTSRPHDCIDAWSCRKQRLAGGVTVRDFNPNHPSMDIAGTTAIDQMSRGADYCYGENIRDVEEATYLSEIRAEESLCKKTRYYGEGSVTRLQSGYLFEMGMHPNENYNGIEYLAVEVNHEGQHLDMQMSSGSTQAQPHYRNSFVAIEAGEQFRPARVTAKPRFYGTMTAFIYAEAATMKAEIDEFGRYRVHLPFDRADGTLLSTDRNRKASTWIRMAQPYVGQEQGMYYPLTGGTEVLLTFINGDPDQPIISGAVPNASQPSLLSSETNFQRTITTQPSQVITGNTHRISRNSARLARMTEPPLAPHPTGAKLKTDTHRSLSAAYVATSDSSDGVNIANKEFINDGNQQSDVLAGQPTRSMLPPWTGDDPRNPAYPGSFQEDLINFKFYDENLNVVARTLADNSDTEEMNSDYLKIDENEDGKDDNDDGDDYLEVFGSDRSGGDEYVYANRRTFAYPQHERVYFIGTFHEDFHVKDNFMDSGESWTGVTEQFNFPAPGEDFPVVGGVKLEGEKNSDIDVNPKGIRGVSEDKRWGDQMNYAWGRVFNWGGGAEMGTGNAGGEYNYGNAYTENLLEATGSNAKDLYGSHRDEWDYSDNWLPAPLTDNTATLFAGAVGIVPKLLGDLGDVMEINGVSKPTLNGVTGRSTLSPDRSGVEKTFGSTYSYQAGLAVDIHEGNSIARTYGDSESYTFGDSEEVVIGDKYETHAGSTTSVFLGGGLSFSLAGEADFKLAESFELFAGLKQEISISKNFAFHLGFLFDFTVAAGCEYKSAAVFEIKNAKMKKEDAELEDKLAKISNTQTVLKNRTNTIIRDVNVLQAETLQLQNVALLLLS